LHRQFLDVDVGAAQRRELRREVTHVAGVDAAPVDQAGHFDAASIPT
jgi:hypothetical protein